MMSDLESLIPNSSQELAANDFDYGHNDVPGTSIAKESFVMSNAAANMNTMMQYPTPSKASYLNPTQSSIYDDQSSLLLANNNASYLPERPYTASPVCQRLREFNNYSPFVDQERFQLKYSKIPIEDVLALRDFLKQVDISKFGFSQSTTTTGSQTHHPPLESTKVKEKETSPQQYHQKKSSKYPQQQYRYHHLMTKDHKNEGDLSTIPMYPTPTASVSISDYNEYARFLPNRITAADYEPYKSPRIAAFQTQQQDKLSSIHPSNSYSNPMTTTHLPTHSPVKSSARSSPSPLATSHHGNSGSGSGSGSTKGLPYKGKFGPNPVCASCHTTKTPYWRDAWHQGILLCNACGLRFAKFRRRCTACHYVPRKEDKGNRNCPLCKGTWTQ